MNPYQAHGGVARYRVRRDSYIFQDKNAQEIVTTLLADYLAAHVQFDITQPLAARPICTQYRESDLHFLTRVLAAEGLSWRFQHEQGDAVAPDTAGAPGAFRAKHLLVIFDPHALAPEMPGDRALRFHGIRATDSRDAITRFSAKHRVQPNAVAVSRWNPTHLTAPSAEQTAALDNGAVPRISIYDPAPAQHHATAAAAAQHSQRLLQACELPGHTFAGVGSVRHLAAGHTFSLTQHDNYPIGHNDFTVLWVEHAAVNNLDARIIQHATALPGHDHHHRLNDPDAPASYHDPERLTAHSLEHGTPDQVEGGLYRNRFTCVRHTVPIVPLATAQPRPPTALGPQIAHVIAPAITGEHAPIVTDRDHRVLIRFPWQRPVIDPTTGATTPAPGQWARVSEALAGPNWGSLFTPRVGTEVLINFIDNDIDHPMIVGCLYNGDDLPPYSAGVDSNINHPGTLSGIHSHGLDGQGYNQWQIDDSATQLRMRLASSSQTSQLNLGHLIAQTPGTAQRGAYRGQGFELRSDAHSVLRGGTGLLLTTTPRPGQGTSVTSTQLDAAESHAQLTSAADLTQAVYTAAAQQSAHTSPHTQQSQRDFTDTLKPAHDTQLPGQPYTRPAILLDSPASIAWISPASTAVSAAAQIHSTSQSDLHLAAAQTIASVAGNTTTLFTHSGGLQAIAAHGPLSLQAHTDALDILADQSVTVTSVNGRIDIKAKQKIVLHAGQSSITLEGANITFACPGKISIKGGVHGFKGGAGNKAELEGLPVGGAGVAPNFIELNHHDEQLRPMAGYDYRVVFEDGTVRTGKLDGNGYARLDGVPHQAAQVFYGESPAPFTLQSPTAEEVTDEALAADLRKLGLDPEHVDLQALVQRETGRGA